FYLEEVGPLSNVNKKYFNNKIDFWNKITEHPNYDDFWQKRNLLPHLKDIKPAILVVGGWFDAEDLYGPLNIYKKIETSSPGAQNFLVMGPWRHGGWTRGNGESLGNVKFSSSPSPSVFYREKIEFPFFMQTLKTGKNLKLAEATMYNTGEDKWRKFDQWPPSEIVIKKLFLQPDGNISETPPGNERTFREYTSDPAKPVPFSQTISTRMTREYMTADQRFAARRPDVLVYQTVILEEDLTLAGKIEANLFVSISQTDSDWIVKLIDVYPNDTPNNEFTATNMHMGGYQQMVRSEVFRGRFRNSYEFPEPFIPGEITAVSFPLQDVLHTFKKGHRLMIQIQSSWFPIVDRNPQKYVENIFNAEEEDFVPSIQRVYSFGVQASHIEINVLED
ncbi:MAG: CocE/NonD family hydrolase, partial [Bacteroidota bacterium]|nr:CocE/NonD family hydrolase [Bacteroidota bacterium]